MVHELHFQHTEHPESETRSGNGIFIFKVTANNYTASR